MAKKKGSTINNDGGVAVLEPPAGAAVVGAPPGPAEFQTLRLDQLAESPHNPRKHFDPVALEELASSIRLSGIYEPILVRPLKADHGVYEIASGHRRYRAAKLAGLTEVPVLIRTMDEATFIELLTVANLQREDVHPLEECDAYVEMMKTLRWDVPTIAQKVGKGQTYIYDTLKYQSLIPQARELFFAGTGGFTPAHAIQLSRISAEAQLRAIGVDDTASEWRDRSGGLWQRETVEALTEAEGLALEEAEAKDPTVGRKVRTARELKGWIDAHIRFKAAEADPVLFPETVAMVASAELAKVKVVHITYDYRVHDDAKDRDGKRTYGSAKWKRADGEDDSKGCPHAVLGLVVAGPDRGKAFDVCVANDTCKVHWAAEMRAKARRATDAEDTSTAASAPREQPWERQRRLEEEARARFKPAIPHVVDALVAVIRKASVKVGGPLDAVIFRRRGKPSAKARIKRGTSPEDLMRYLAYADMADFNDWSASAHLAKIGKILGVNVAAIAKQHVPREEKASPAKATKTKGGKR